MFYPVRRLARFMVSFLLFAGVTLYLRLSYLAGCAGDLKGGALGDPIRALELEGYSLAPYLVAVFCVFLFAHLCGRHKTTARIAISTAFCVTLGTCLWIAGIYLEGYGVESCFFHQ
ncbi:hypothetical protein [Polaromonas hydrogenivorans]|uniref:Uncharacterized protein n=1 Tax=Polaromonas hydrogenivorans TaxID=335476 RepID=A0AAU7LV91_9BURK